MITLTLTPAELSTLLANSKATLAQYERGNRSEYYMRECRESVAQYQAALDAVTETTKSVKITEYADGRFTVAAA